MIYFKVKKSQVLCENDKSKLYRSYYHTCVLSSVLFWCLFLFTNFLVFGRNFSMFTVSILNSQVPFL